MLVGGRIGLDDAFQAQTILAYDMNAAVAHRAWEPVRLRVEAVTSFPHIRGGKGGYWEDRGYAWYAGS